MRLYIPDTLLHAGATIALDDAHSHYALRVMRMCSGDAVVLFNHASGGWRGVLAVTGKRAAITLDAQVQKPMILPDIWALIPPLKKEAWDFAVEKAVEMGATAIMPTITDRTQHTRVNMDRMRANVIEAAQQCERTDIPNIFDPAPLRHILDRWDSTRTLYVALERSDAPRAVAATVPAAILVGPEGGFTDAERDMVRGKKYVVPLSLGPLVLRAETAVIAALAALQPK
jgi:16S rRNA (uracil1498-N3)-methyltransferase